MSKMTNDGIDGLTRSGTGCFIAVGYPYGNSGRQRVNLEPMTCLSTLEDVNSLVTL